MRRYRHRSVMGVDFAEEEQFGPYLVYERLGVGGMATVHRALERGIEGFERIVALKRLLPHLAEDASFIKSFVREAKLASLLNHVNIVQIFELGRVGTEYFISMEHIDGRDIRRILRHARKVTGPPPIHVTVGLLIQLCEALDYAHSKVDDHGTALGLVHRDVSPSNLLVTQAGHLKVIDFGIAKAQSQQLRTQTGRVKGKLAYMAPEAINGKELDARSDVFAAGVILHELLTARPLFASKNEYQTLIKVQKGDILLPSTFNQACPPELDAICLRALERDPDTRYASAADMRDELHALRRRMNLQTGHRDISQWLTWAFSIEAPSSSFGAVGSRDHSVSFDADMRHAASPRKPIGAAEEEEVVEIAWGGGEREGGAPVVLDDVPDVSDRHEHSVAARMNFAGALGDEDDIPITTPSHGHGSRVMAQLRDELDSIPDMPVASARPAVAAATVAGRRVTQRPPTATQQTLRAPTAPSMAPNRTTPPPLATRATSTGQIPAARPTPPPIPRAAGTFSPDVTPTRDRKITARGAGAVTASDYSYPAPPAHARTPTELPTRPSDEDLRPAPPDTLDPDENSPSVRYKAPTQPGDVITARPSTGSLLLDSSDGVPKKSGTEVTIGQSMIQRRAPRKTWVVLLGLGAAGAAAVAVTLVATRGDDKVNSVSTSSSNAGAATLTPDRLFGTLKFMIEPPDADIKLVEKKLEHAGSPWTTQLEPGVHQIQIQREGYKAWLTSIELSANETQTLRVVLEPLSDKAAASEATLTLDSTPSGLEAFLDGRLLGVTPIKAQIKPGPHGIVLRQDGKEVWREDLAAKAAVVYEFNPVMTVEKQRERAQRAAPPERRDRETPPVTPDAAPAIEKTVEKQPELPKPTPGSAAAAPTNKPVPPEAPKPVTPVPAPVTPPPVVPAPITPKPTGPVVVPPSAVQRISGEMPTLGKTKRAETPPVVAAKVCIDTTGRVSSVDMITKLERLTSMDLGTAVKSWRYAPYKQNGVATAACFVVSFRVQ
jgi:eukaryotic-like serine/threonine-protein kinase